MSEEPLYTAYLKGSLRLSANGEWFHNGVPFSNKKLADYFSKSIVWDEDSQQFLVRIGKGQAEFDYDDTVYFVRSFEEDEAGWLLSLSDNRSERLIPESLRIGSQGQIYCKLNNGHYAKFLRSCHQQIASLCVSETEIILAGSLYKLKPLNEE